MAGKMLDSAKLARVKQEDFDTEYNSDDDGEEQESIGRGRRTRRRVSRSTYNYNDEDDEDEEDIDDDEDSIKEEKFDTEFDGSEGSSVQESGSEWEGDEIVKNIKKEKKEPKSKYVKKLKKKTDIVTKNGQMYKDGKPFKDARLFDNTDPMTFDSDDDVRDEDTDVIYYVCLEDVKLCNIRTYERKITRLPPDAENVVSTTEQSDGKFACLKCPIIYLKKSTVRNHLREKHNFDVFECEECDDVKVYFLSDLLSHQLQNHKDPHLTCPTCHEKFAADKAEEVETHYKTNHIVRRKKKFKPRPRICEICGKSLSSKMSLDRHMNAHLGIKPMKCDQCDFATAYYNSLADHKKSHLKIPGMWKKERVVCEICGKSFAGKGNMREHVAIVHEGLKDRYECAECGLKFTHKASRRRHVAADHRGKPQPWILKKQEARRKRLEEQGIDPSEPREKKKYIRKRIIGDFPCQYCGTILKSAYSLKNHIRMHTGEKPFVCEHCGDKYCSSSALSKHRRFIHGTTLNGNLPKVYTCEICGKVFKVKIVYHDHMDSHRGVKKYQCLQCNWTTSFKSALRNHKKRKHVDVQKARQKNLQYYAKQEPSDDQDDMSQ